MKDNRIFQNKQYDNGLPPSEKHWSRDFLEFFALMVGLFAIGKYVIVPILRFITGG